LKILIVKTSAIGDVIHSLPALTCLRKKFPEAHIDWLVEEEASEAVIGHRAVNTVLVSQRKKWIRLLKQGRLLEAGRGLLSFVRKLRTTEYDLLIDFQGLLKSGIFVFLARAKRKAGFDKGMEHAEGSWIFLNERILPINMDQHAIHRERLLLAALDISCQEVFFDFPINELHRQEAESLLKENGVDLERPMVAINPLTTWPTKHWYADRFAQVADQLCAMGQTIVFTGGPQDAVGVETIIAAMTGTAINLAGKTSLKSLAAIYQRAAMLITTDTGPMHLAAAVGTPVVALFGPTAPWRTGPFGIGHQVLRADLSCSPCFKKKCDLGQECMTRIEVAQVLTAAHAVLGR